MKKILVIFFLLLSASFVKAHPILKGLEKSFESQKYADLQTYLDGLQDQSTVEIEYQYSTAIYREVVTGYFESKYEIEQRTLNEGSDRSWSVDRFFISVIHKGNAIIIYRIYENFQTKNLVDEWIQTPKLIKELKDSAQIKYFENAFVNMYGAPLNFDDLFVDDIVYGSNCGFGGGDPKYRQELNLIIQKKDKKTLLKWLTSATAEVQLYAIDGILELSTKGLRFKADTYDLIKIISQKEGDVYTCSGCIHWNRPIQETAKAIFVKHDFIKE
jgi:hypothetical protein